MKKAMLAVCLVLFSVSNLFSQVSGNRIYGNSGYAQNKRAPVLNSGNLRTDNSRTDYAIEASVLFNSKPDSFVAVFGVAGEGADAIASNSKVNAVIENFRASLTRLGIAKDSVYVDFITQNRVYEYEAEAGFAQETLKGFETKKTVAIKYRSPELVEKLVSAAAEAKIFDLIKVDYIVEDFDSVRERLFDEAAKVIKAKESKYRKAFDANIKSIGLSIEKYDAFYPSNRYENYKAFESGAVTTRYSYGKNVLQLRKSSTFFYDPVPGAGFDKVLNEIGIEPTVQFTLLLRVDYDLIRDPVPQK